MYSNHIKVQNFHIIQFYITSKEDTKTFLKLSFLKQMYDTLCDINLLIDIGDVYLEVCIAKWYNCNLYCTEVLFRLKNII